MGPSVDNTGGVGICPDVRLIIIGHHIGCLDIWYGDLGGNCWKTTGKHDQYVLNNFLFKSSHMFRKVIDDFTKLHTCTNLPRKDK